MFQDAQRKEDEEASLPSYVRGGGGGGEVHMEQPEEQQQRQPQQMPARRRARSPSHVYRQPQQPTPQPPPRQQQRRRVREDADDDDVVDDRELTDLAEQRRRNLERVDTRTIGRGGRQGPRDRRNDDDAVYNDDNDDGGAGQGRHSQVRGKQIRMVRAVSPVEKRVGRSKIEETGMSLEKDMSAFRPGSAQPLIADILRQKHIQQQQQQQKKDPLLDIGDYDGIEHQQQNPREEEEEELERQREQEQKRERAKLAQQRRQSLEQRKADYEASKMHPTDVRRHEEARQKRFLQQNAMINSRSKREREDERKTHYGDVHGLAMTELLELDAAVPVHRFTECRNTSLDGNVKFFLDAYQKQHGLSHKRIATDMYKCGVKYIWLMNGGALFYGTELQYLEKMRARTIQEALGKIS